MSIRRAQAEDFPALLQIWKPCLLRRHIFGRATAKPCWSMPASTQARWGGDVNEHSPRAVSFYLANGFVIHSRSETDGQGNPFPLLHLIESRTVV